MEELYSQLAALARRYGAKRLVLFGSRARGDNRYNSDIDLAVYGMPPDNRAEFWMECEDLPTLLKFDIVHMQDGMNPAFVANIEKGWCRADGYYSSTRSFATALNRTTDLGLGVLPFLATQLIQLRLLRRIGGGVFLDYIQSGSENVQIATVPVLNLQIILDNVFYLYLFDAFVYPQSVGLMHYVITDLQVIEIVDLLPLVEFFFFFLRFSDPKISLSDSTTNFSHGYSNPLFT